MSSSTERSLTMHLWAIGYRPPLGGFAVWGKFKNPQWYHSHDSWGVLPFPLFSDKEEAANALAENELDKDTYRVVLVKATVSEIPEEEVIG